MRKTSLIVSIGAGWLAVAFATAAFAQVPKGDRIRLQVDPVGKIDGQFVASDDSSVTVLSRSSTLQIDRDKIERVQRYQGEHRNWKRGALIGAGVGLTFGLLIEAVGSMEGESTHGAAALSLTICAGGFGALIGGLIKTDDWKTLPVESLNVSLGRESGIGLTLTASF